LTYLLEKLGRNAILFIAHVGAVAILLGKICLAVPRIFQNLRLTTEQMLVIGVRSLPLVFITSIFTGAVSAWQAAYQFKGFIPMKYLGAAVGKAVIIELGPVLTALVVAGRVGSSIAAELGTMKVTEQIDALECLAIDPVRFLALPRFMAGIIMLPVLVVFADLLALVGAYLVSSLFLNLPTSVFMSGVKMFFFASDVSASLIKAFVFGAITALMGCYFGFNTSGGAEGVGNATIKAVVSSSVLILINDYIIASILF
jgi:phospholipid/cholesterol/gamma-HCH transport system permease protein